MTPHRAEKKKNGGIVPPPVPPEVAAVGAAGRPHRDQNAPIDPIQKTALDCLIKTLQEKVTASYLKGLPHPQEHLRGHAGPDRERPKNPQRNPDLGHDRRTVLTRNQKKANTETSGYYGKMPGLSFVPQICPVNHCEGQFPLSPLLLKLTHIGTRTVFKGHL